MLSEQSDITSLIPIVITLIISLITRNVIMGLFIGVFTGVVMLNEVWHTFEFTSLFDVTNDLVKNHLVPQLTDSYNAGVIVLLVFIGGFVALMENSGGGSAFARKVITLISSRCQAQCSAWLGGILIFFSDLGTPLIVGPVFRPLFDKLKVSRQKLAFIIDSTASPVAILIPFIGWGVYIMSLLQKEFTALSLPLSDWDAFIAAIPYQFYAILAIVTVPLIALFKLDFGSMAQAEMEVQNSKTIDSTKETLTPFTHDNASPSFVWAPLLMMALVFFTSLIPLGFPFQKVAGSDFRAALSSAYFFAALTLIGLMAYYGVRKLMEGIQLYLKGMERILPVAVMLILAWTLSHIGSELGTSTYIAEQAQKGFPYWLLPAMTFVLSGIISFATGSSWGTFAIMFPLVIPAAIAIDAPLYVAIGATLSGGLFGDHCSPISETTILSSTGAGCDQYDHFKTQLPYALLNGLVTFFGLLIAGYIHSPYVIVAMVGLQIMLFIILSKIAKARGERYSYQADLT